MIGDKDEVVSKTMKIQMVQWAENFNGVIKMDEWKFFWNKILKITKQTIRLKENSIKMFYRWYATLEMIAQMSNSKLSDNCWKCGNEKGPFYHMWWLCPKVKKFGDLIFLELVKIFKVNFKKSLELMLLGLKLDEFNIRVPLWYLLTAARIQYASLWKQRKIPKVENWLISLMNIIEMGKITRRLSLQDQQDFEDCWCKVIIYMENTLTVKRFLKVFEWTG